MSSRKEESSYASGCNLPKTPIRSHDYFQLESRWAPIESSNGGAPFLLHYKVAGRGEPLLLIHGLMTDSYSFRYVISKLAAHFQVFALDLPGAGESDSPLTLSLSPQSLALVLSKFVLKLGLGPVFVVGNSLGGYEALWFSLLYSDQVRRLMMIHSPGIPELKIQLLSGATQFEMVKSLYRRLVTTDPERFIARRVHYYDSATMSQEEAIRYGRIFRDPARLELFWRVLKESLDVHAMYALRLVLEERRKALARIPVRLVWARQDPLVPPRFGSIYQGLIPGASLVWVDHSYHFIQVDQPERMIEEILQFRSD